MATNNKNKDFTLNEQQAKLVLEAIQTQIRALYRDADAYKRNGNQEAMMDCFAEVKKYQALKDELK